MLVTENHGSAIRSDCRRRLESLELWLRRLIDELLSATYGDYWQHKDNRGNRLIAKSISESLEERVLREPTRYPRKVDAILLDDAISIICNPAIYASFRPALQNAFPEGQAEARTFLNRLLGPRNRLAHSNPISDHDALRVMCYSSDVISSIRDFYRQKGMQQEYNVPTILRFTDSFASSFHRDQMHKTASGGMLLDFQQASDHELRPGDCLRCEIEIDPSFPIDSYTIEWMYVKSGRQVFSREPNAVLPITNAHVGERLTIRCNLIANQEWHRLDDGLDDWLQAIYRVLPPPR